MPVDVVRRSFVRRERKRLRSVVSKEVQCTSSTEYSTSHPAGRHEIDKSLRQAQTSFGLARYPLPTFLQPQLPKNNCNNEVLLSSIAPSSSRVLRTCVTCPTTVRLYQESVPDDQSAYSDQCLPVYRNAHVPRSGAKPKMKITQDCSICFSLGHCASHIVDQCFHFPTFLLAWHDCILSKCPSKGLLLLEHASN